MDTNQIQQGLQQELAGKLKMIGPDEPKEEFILTDDEIKKVKQHHFESLKRHKMFKLATSGLDEKDIEKKILETIDYTECLDYANMCKHRQLDQEKYDNERRQKEKEERDTLIQLCNAKYMYNVMAHTSLHVYGKKLIVNEFNKKLITSLCFFCSEDARFVEELKFNPAKGLWVFGNVGVGKTYLVKCLSDNLLNPIAITSMIEITAQVKDSGDYNLPTSKKIYIDDVGTEEPLVNHYGTKITFFKTFIESTYLEQMTFSNLIVSTNLSFDDIERIYGFRVRSRIKDMFNIIYVDGTDMRGAD